MYAPICRLLILALAVLGGARVLADGAAAAIPLLDGSLRPFPGAFGVRDIRGLTLDPGGAPLVAVAPGRSVIRFDPRRQRMELADEPTPQPDSGAAAGGSVANTLIDGRSRLCPGPDGSLYGIIRAKGLSCVTRLDPRTGITNNLGALSCGGKPVTSRAMRAMAVGGDGRIWLAVHDGQLGGALLAVPPLDERAPWTNSERSYRCRSARAGAIRIDGALDEPEWQAAEVADDFVTAGFRPEPARYRTRSRLLWTATHLIVAHDCVTDGIRTGITRRDATIWDGEAAEMMICPMGAEAPYYEININPLNALYDARLLDYSYPAQAAFAERWATNWNAAIESAVAVHTNAAGQVAGWSAEMAIPFADLDAGRNNPPAPGTLWTFNFFRAAMQADRQIEWSAWTSTHSEFHRPFDFPRLLFTR